MCVCVWGDGLRSEALKKREHKPLITGEKKGSIKKEEYGCYSSYLPSWELPCADVKAEEKDCH